MIRLSPVVLGAEEERNVLEVLRTGWLAQGPMVRRLEDGFRALTGADHAVAVSSGTTALVAALETLDLEPGAEVITSPFTFAATINAVIEAGATVRFADIGTDFNIDPASLEAAVTPRTRALLPVHLYGKPCDVAAIRSIAARHGLAVVEDAAQAHGAEVGGERVGRRGVACFSLYATKNMTTGEGGMITTDDPVTADRLRVLRNQGMRAKYDYEVPGHNYRLTDLQAAIGLPQLARLEEHNARRRANAAYLDQHLAGLAGVALPDVSPGHVFHQYTIRVTGAARLDRDAAREALGERGVESGVFYPRVAFDYKCYLDHPAVITGPMPEAERAAAEVLSLPVHQHLTEDERERVVGVVREVFDA